MLTGLGDEKLWLCPTLDNVNPFNDLSSQANNGTAVGGLSTVADTSNGGAFAFDLDGVDDYIDCGNILDAPTDFSLSLWLETSSPQANTGVAGRWTNSPTFSGYMMWVSSANKVSVPIAAGGHLEAATTVPTSSWVHAVVMYDSSIGQSRIYIDGVLSSFGLETGPTASSVNWIVGRYTSGSQEYFQGKLDDIRQYDRTLTQAEIAHLAEARGITGSPPQGLGDEQLWLCPSINNSPNDISGNGNNGVYNGGMGTVTDVSNGGSLAYDFDGTDDYISNSSLSLAGLTEFSYSGWLNASTSSGHRAIFSHGDNFDYDDDIYILNNSSNFQAEVNNGSPVGGNGSASLPALNTWHHIAVVFDGSGATNADRLRYFLNGVEVTLTYNYTVPTSTSSVSPMNTEIGSFASYGALHFWQGKQDDIRVYDRVLTQSEITHLASQRGVLGAPTLSTRYYDFGPSSSPVKSGYQQVTEAAYDSNLFGWGFSETSGTAVNSYDRNWGTDDMERDFCYQSIARIFRDPTVIAGDYTIKAYCGDLGYTRDLYIDVWNGSAWVDTTIQMNSVPSGTIQTATADITVGDNGVAGLYIRTRNVTSSNWVICGLDLTPAGGGPPATTQYNAFATHAFTQLFQQRLR